MNMINERVEHRCGHAVTYRINQDAFRSGDVIDDILHCMGNVTCSLCGPIELNSYGIALAQPGGYTPTSGLFAHVDDSGREGFQYLHFSLRGVVHRRGAFYEHYFVAKNPTLQRKLQFHIIHPKSGALLKPKPYDDFKPKAFNHGFAPLAVHQFKRRSINLTEVALNFPGIFFNEGMVNRG